MLLYSANTNFPIVIHVYHVTLLCVTKRCCTTAYHYYFPRHYHMLDYEMPEQPINDSELEIHVPGIEECFPTQQNTRAITKAEDLKNEVPYIG